MKPAVWLLGCALLLVPDPVRAQSATAVYDANTYAENVLIAARALQQIDNQVQELQNQALILQNMSRSFTAADGSSLAPIVQDLDTIRSLLGSAQAIAFTLSASQSALARSYPDTYSGPLTAAALNQDAQQRWQDAMGAFKDSVTLQAQLVQNVQSDSTTVASLIGLSQNSTGNLSVQQYGNQLLALVVKQQLQMEALLAEEGRFSALDAARRAQDEAAAAADFSQFIGAADAYTPD